MHYVENVSFHNSMSEESFGLPLPTSQLFHLKSMNWLQSSEGLLLTTHSPHLIIPSNNHMCVPLHIRTYICYYGSER